MAIYRKGDVALVWQVWRNKDGSVGRKVRPGIVYDVLAEDHYCILIFGTDRTGIIPGFRIEANSKEGKQMRLNKDSFVNLQRIVKLRKTDMVKLKGYCSEELMDRIEEMIDDFGIERPLN